MKRKFIISFFVTALTVVFSACNMNAPEKLYTDTTPPAPVTEVSSEVGDKNFLITDSDFNSAKYGY